MSRRVANLTLDNLTDLPVRCRTCVFWELDPVAGQAAAEAGDLALEKEAWLSATLLDWGSCGKIVYVDSLPAGYLTYAPPTHVPRSLAFPTSPVSGDAVLLMTGTVQPEFAGTGLGRMLVQSAAKDLTRRGVRAIEAFGRIDRRDRESAAADPEAPERAGHDELAGLLDPMDGPGGPGRLVHGRSARSSCVVPADFLLAVGFKTVRPHHRFPRLRLDLRTAVSWRADVEVALERLLGSMSPEPAFRPV